MRMPSQVDIGPTVRPSLSLSPSEVVSAQFKALSRGRVGQDRDGVAGIDAALGFVAPNIVEQRGTELNTSRLGRRAAASRSPLSAKDGQTVPRAAPGASANLRPISRSCGSGALASVWPHDDTTHGPNLL